MDRRSRSEYQEFRGISILVVGSENHRAKAYARLLAEPRPGAVQVSDAVQNDVLIIRQAGDFYHRWNCPTAVRLHTIRPKRDARRMAFYQL